MTKRKKIIIVVITPIIALMLAFAILCFVTMGMYSPAYLGRVLTHFDSDVSDYKLFPSREIAASDNPFVYGYNLNSALNELSVEYKSGKKNLKTNLKSFVKDTKTTSFIIVKDDKIIFEEYANGYNKDSLNTSFSMSKSVVSLLIGKAIQDGYIADIGQNISTYIPEFVGLDIGKTTIEQLLLMRSDIEYEEDKFLWFGDDSLTYWHPDLRGLALNHTKITSRYKGKFHYNNYHPLLLGIILERSTGMSVSEFFERSFWKPIGAEFTASWSLDSEKSGFEKMESGINFRAIDFVKIGSMVLHDGFWNGAQIINEKWLKQSTLCDFPIDKSEYENTFIAKRNIGYKYMWYTYQSAEDTLDIIAWGKSDQILYISPANNTVILRTGKTDGGVSDWVETLSMIANSIA